MRNLNDIVLNALDASTNQTSAAISAEQLYKASLVVTTTSTVTGTCKFQWSNDLTQNGVVTNWVDIPSKTVSVAAAGSVGIDQFDLCAQWIRIVWTNTANTGTVTARLVAKGF